jgi:polysaccharide deacetylase family protein (PEP-CTERM system associated)
MLALFDELGLRCTFFILGLAARAHPDLVRTIASCGHELACHGDQHQPVRAQTPAEFRSDLRAAVTTIRELSGRTPRGYRAPGFSVGSAAPWAQEVLAEEGFAYDASQCDSFAIRDGVQSAHRGPHPLRQGDLWEFPVATWRSRTLCMPVGGASYWSLAPTNVVLQCLEQSGAGAGLYLHPHELDPRPLRPMLGPGPGPGPRAKTMLRTVRRNVARRRAPDVLRAIADTFPLLPYGEAHGQLAER